MAFLASDQITLIIAICLLAQFLYWSLARRSQQLQEPRLLWLRNLSLLFGGIGGCRFGLYIRWVDFNGADFRHANLQDCRFIRCRFRGAINLHLARTKGTYLEHRRVRELLVTGRTREIDFSNLDLQGARFAGMDLQGLNFSNSNLAGCDFSACQLQKVNFSNANLCGADFSQANLTGACIENWSINAKTLFTGTQCEFVWLESIKNKARRERNPPLPGQKFQAGEFSKLYQQVTETFSFILQQKEIAPLVLALKQLQDEGKLMAEILSQEQKDDSIVLKLGLRTSVEHKQAYALIQSRLQELQAQDLQA